jgi:hypothetical protein
MSKIQITNLQPVGSELFQGGESFLTELQPTEAHTIFGGSSKKGSKKGSKKSSKKGSKKSSGSPVVIIVPCLPCCYH